tara:strand:+ start:664 stop:1200 length:537 start_codon:yes stop_codon:yes gene_type:complete
MCHPAVLGAIGVAQSMAQYAGQRQQARQQQRYQAQASAAERQRFIQEQSAMRMRQAQEQEAMNTELGDIALKSREALSRAGVSAGEAGVSGASVDALLDDYTRQEADHRVALTRQQELQNINTGLALTDAGYRTMNNQIGINRPINRPSFLTAGLGAVQGGMSGYRTGMEIKQMRKGP